MTTKFSYTSLICPPRCGWGAWVRLSGWLGGVLVGLMRPCIEGKLERGGFFVKEAEASGVAGGDRDHMVMDERCHGNG